jgi:hypothetical protein
MYAPNRKNLDEIARPVIKPMRAELVSHNIQPNNPNGAY